MPDPDAPRDVAEADLPALLTLNNEHATELSWLDAAGLRRLVLAAFRARVIGSLAAFVIAFDETADYASPNFLWFRARHDRFVYVDRVCVAPDARGRGLARRLYADVAAAAIRSGRARLCCEVNREPPNPASDAFHAALGFAVVGTGEGAGGKIVRYLERSDERMIA